MTSKDDDLQNYIIWGLGLGSIYTTWNFAQDCTGDVTCTETDENGKEVPAPPMIDPLPFLVAIVVSLLIYYVVFPRIPTISNKMKIFYGLLLYNIIQYLVYRYSPVGMSLDDITS